MFRNDAIRITQWWRCLHPLKMFQSVFPAIRCDTNIHLNYQAMRRSLHAERNRMTERCVLHFTKGNCPGQNCAGAKSELRMCRNRFVREKGSRTLTPLRTAPHSIVIYCSVLKTWAEGSPTGKKNEFTWTRDRFANELWRDRNSGREGVFIRAPAAGRQPLAS